MYEKYSGLPDTTKSSSQNGSRGANRPANHSAYSNDGDDRLEYYHAPDRNENSASARRASARRAKIRKRRFILSLMSFAFLALIVVAIVVLVKNCSGPVEVDLETGKFRSGVYINGMDLSGKTVDEVKSQLESNEAYALNNISITLASSEINATVTGADMNVTSDLDAVIEQALSGGANQVYYTKISIDQAALEQRIEDINATMSTPPVDASFTIDFSSSGKPIITPVDGSTGYGLDVDSTVALIQQAIEAGQFQTTVQPTLTTVQPSVTSDDVLKHVSLIGSFTTTYSFKGTAEDTELQRELIPNRAFNVEKAASLINNQVVKPGRTWSFNDTVGDRNEKNGWLQANGIFGGDTMTQQWGGGVCQVSTTLYNALLEAYPYFDFVDRQAHSIPSTYVSKGLDATVDTGHIDFQFKNTSEYPVYIFAYSTENKMSKSRKRDLTVQIYGEALPEGVEYKTRTVLISEEAPGEDIITESSKMYIGEEKTLAEPRSKYVVDVYVDRYLNDELQEEIYLYTDTYDGNPLRKLVGTKPTPTPEVSPTPTPNPEDMP